MRFSFGRLETEHPVHRECINKFGDNMGNEVWRAINNAFDVMPLAAVIDGVVGSSFFKFAFRKASSRFFVVMVGYHHHGSALLLQPSTAYQSHCHNPTNKAV